MGELDGSWAFVYWPNGLPITKTQLSKTHSSISWIFVVSSFFLSGFSCVFKRRGFQHQTDRNGVWDWAGCCIVGVHCRAGSMWITSCIFTPSLFPGRHGHRYHITKILPTPKRWWPTKKANAHNEKDCSLKHADQVSTVAIHHYDHSESFTTQGTTVDIESIQFTSLLQQFLHLDILLFSPAGDISCWEGF